MRPIRSDERSCIRQPGGLAVGPEENQGRAGFNWGLGARVIVPRQTPIAGTWQGLAHIQQGEPALKQPIQKRLRWRLALSTSTQGTNSQEPTMYKKAILPLIAVTAIAAAMPAAAQNRGGGHDRGHDRGDRYEQNWDRGWDRIDRRFERLDRRIDQGVRNGQLSRREATRLRSEFRQLIQLEHRYSRGGLSRWERNDLDRRFDRLSAQIRYERHDNNNRGGRGNGGGRRH